MTPWATPPSRGGPPAHVRGAHRRQKLDHGGHRRVLFASVALAAAVALAAGGLLIARSQSTTSKASGTAGAVSSSKGGGSGASSTAGSKTLKVVSTTPAAQASGVDPAATLAVSFSAPLSSASPLPSLSPAVAGTWTLSSPKTATFDAQAPMIPSSSESIVVPGGSSGVKGAKGQHLASSVTVPFTVAQGSVGRLQELLAQLNYLPLSFTPTAPLPAPKDLADTQPGTWAWRWPNQPAQLIAQWTEGTGNVITKGAVMAFEDQHSLGVDGVAGPQVWAALLQAAVTNQVDAQPYPYVQVQLALPQTVTVYQNGAPVYSTPANTGVAGAPTAPGTFTVFERFTTTTMTGTNVDGSTYSDPGVPWVSYFNGGDALHGFVRASYGFPQSDGCVEMPVQNAQVVYPMTPLGTLVTVA